MLSIIPFQLKALVDNGLVERKQYESIPPKVEYSLTEIGKKFRPVIDALQNWGYEYIEYLQKDKEQMSTDRFLFVELMR